METPERIQQYSAPLVTAGGTHYGVSVYGTQRADGLWSGWLVFTPMEGGSVLRTGRETTQPSRDALTYWASGLEPAYWEGAFHRAH